MMTLTRFEIDLLREHFPEQAEFLSAKARVEEGEPLAYVLGEWYFYGETYRLNRDCLIPRPDTEHLVEWLITHMPKGGCFADLCTGSGCIAISALVHRPDLRAAAVDISPGALEMARYNAKANGVLDRITFALADVKRGEGLTGVFDVIVSNPPYIHTAVIETLSEQVKREPRRALDGGEDGMDFYRAILEQYPKHLKDGGSMVFEIGYDQAQAMRDLHECEIFKDYGGNDRVAVLRF